SVGLSGLTAQRAAYSVRVLDDLEKLGKITEAQHLRHTLNQNVGKAYRVACDLAPLTQPAAPPLVVVPQHPFITLEQWHALSADEQRHIIATAPTATREGWNQQENESIGWARWSWNPVTGCLTGCEYCYARDIAERPYPQKFAPVFHPSRLHTPRNMRVPGEAHVNIGDKNVFVCSMADLFGKWVPTEWIAAVLSVANDCPQWN